MKVEGPFVDWPPNLLEEVMEALYAKRSGLKHLIHLVIQPQMTSFSIKAQFSIFDKSRLVVPGSSHILVTSFLVFCHLGCCMVFCTMFSVWAGQNEK